MSNETPEQFLDANTQSLSQWHKDYENDTELVHKQDAMKFARLKSLEDNKEMVDVLRELAKRIDVDSDDLYDLNIRQLITKHTPKG